MITLQFFRKNPRFMRIMACTSMALFLSEIIYPTAAMALTSGPAQPEFSSFEPVVTTNMVNDFTGDFTYNLPILQVPGPNGGGYPLSLSYHAGASPEEEASWVGYGWTLNAGAINRQVRGVADDWNGETIHTINEVPATHTLATGGDVAAELFSTNIPFNLNATLRYNNYTGYGYTIGVGATLVRGIVSVGFSVSDGAGSFPLSVSPSRILGLFSEKKEEDKKVDDEEGGDSDSGTEQANNGSSGNQNTQASSKLGTVLDFASSYGMQAMATPTYSLSIPEMVGESFSLSATFMPTITPIQVGVQGGAMGSYTVDRAQNRTDDAFGSLYTLQGEANGNYTMLDYHAENTGTLNKRDKYIQVPFNDPDIFVSTGEGIGGSFKLFRRNVNQFRPAKSSSSKSLVTLSAEFQAGASTGGGTTLQVGSQSLNLQGWDHSPTSETSDEPFFFRFSNDMGGWVRYNTNDEPQRAELYAPGTINPPGFKEFNYDSELGQESLVNSGERSRRSTYVGYNTAGQKNEVVPGTSIKPNAYEKSAENNIVSGGFGLGQLNTDHFSEFSLLNESGQRYTYGLPVYASDEISYSYHTDLGTLAPQNHAMVYGDQSTIVNTTEAKVGRVSMAPYANSFLLTSIADKDYVDRTNDGPSFDDFGGYTTFKYHQQYGSSDKTQSSNNYRWRMPYNGFYYDDGSLSACHDNMMSFATGLKEVYYMEEVRTKTHVAKFILNDENDVTEYREDALAAAAGAGLSSDQSSQQLRYVDRIELFAVEDENDPTAKPIKTVHFEYNYECWPGVPNNLNNGAHEKGTGKLTLKKVWFEYNGVVEAMIAPYNFGYNYPAAGTYPAHYTSLEMSADLVEDPSYDPYSTDGWGAYRDDGAARASDRTPWLEQYPDYLTVAGQNQQAVPFDPAAWQLKVIELPSGGQIHVQYDQDDYLHVQDEVVHVMVPLHSSVDTKNVIIDPASLGIESQADVDLWVAQIQREYVTRDNKMYFGFLYELLSGQGFNGRNQDLIDGYVSVRSVIRDANDRIKIEFENADHTLPIHVCKDFVNTQRRGMNLNLDCDNNSFPSSVGVDYSNSSTSPAGHMLNFIAGLPNYLDNMVGTLCSDMNVEQSFLRLPLLPGAYEDNAGGDIARSKKGKIGGGLRVQRLLMFEPENVELFGSEYLYETFDHELGRTVSSGVATNEPATIGQENILIQPVPRLRQSMVDRILSGRDKKSVEGPIGKSIYPGPSVGYSKVVSKNISEIPLLAGVNCPVNATGFSVKEFFTAKDHPIRFDMTGLDENTAHKSDMLLLPIPGYTRIKDKQWFAQGFAIKTNAFHGNPKMEATYPGTSELFLQGAPVSYTTASFYDYYDEGEKIPVWDPVNGTTTLQPLGQEMEIAMEDRSVKDHYSSSSTEIDGTVGIAVAIPLLLFGLGVASTKMKTEIYTHSTSKVIRYPAVLKGTRTYGQGIYHISQNIAHDAQTGKSVIVRTHDGFLRDLPYPVEQLASGNTDVPELTDTDLGIYTSYSVSASAIYQDMGQVAKGERKNLETSIYLSISYDQSLEQVGFSGDPTTVCDALGAICSGDLIRLDIAGSAYYVSAVSITGDLVDVDKISYSNVVPSGVVSNMMIVRSGCNNLLKKNVSLFQVYEDGGPMVASGERDMLVQAVNTALLDAQNNGASTSIQVATHAPNETLAPAVTQLDIDVVGNQVIMTVVPNLIGDCTIDLTSATSIALTDDGFLAVQGATGCALLEFPCIQFDAPWYRNTEVTKAVSAVASVYSDDWSYNTSKYDPNNSNLGKNSYEIGERGKWRVASTYDYLSPTNDGGRNFNTGWFDFDLYNWKFESANDDSKWILNNQVVAYSPDGTTLEQRNALGVPSSTKYGYDQTVPYMVAANAANASIQFESFEKLYSSGHLEEGLLLNSLAGALITDRPHSGSNCLHFDNSSGYLFNGNEIAVDDQVADKGLIVKAWLRSEDAFGELVAIPNPTIDILDNTNAVLNSMAMSVIARVGEWTLCSVSIPVNTSSGSVHVALNVDVISGTDTWLDDVCIKPTDAAAQTFVYDPRTLRLLASFDDQHFGLFYKYDAKGQLIAKEVETEKGRLTVNESYVNVPKTEVRP